MSSQETAALLAEIMRQLVEQPTRNVITVEVPGGLRIECRPVAGSSARVALRGLSAEEQVLVDALAEAGDWVVTADLARRLGFDEPSTETKVLLRNLAKAGVLEMDKQKGFRVPEGDKG